MTKKLEGAGLRGQVAGETSLSSFIPALTNAVADAVGVRPIDLPVTPDKLMELIEKRESGQKAAIK